MREEDGRRFLRSVARGIGVQAGIRREWDLQRYPVLAWSWRPLEFPAGADERATRTNDSVLAVYLLVASSSLLGPKAVKYIWSEKVPVGTRLSSNLGQTQVRVLESGTVRRGEWVEERVNVLRDFRAYFAESGHSDARRGSPCSRTPTTPGPPPRATTPTSRPVRDERRTRSLASEPRRTFEASRARSGAR